MLPRLVTLCSIAGAAGIAFSATDPTGRWEGEVRIPGVPMAIVLDLARSAPDGAWVGSLTLPGRGVKGAALTDLGVDADGGVVADAGRAIGGPPSAHPTRLAVRLAAEGRLVGTWQQAGHSAEASFRRSGEPQVDLPPRSSPFPAGLAGVWSGRYELGGYPRDVTLTLSAPSTDTSTVGRASIVGKRRTELPIERVVVSGGDLTIESGGGLRFEGRFDGGSGRIDGWMMQGPFEAPLLLRRAGGSGS